MTNEQIEALFQEIGYSASVEYEEIVFTAETFADFNSSRQQYAQIGHARSATVEGFDYIEYLDVQVRKGQPRKNMVVIDLGDRRAAYAC